jgi:hypothetical protein
LIPLTPPLFFHFTLPLTELSFFSKLAGGNLWSSLGVVRMLSRKPGRVSVLETRHTIPVANAPENIIPEAEFLDVIRTKVLRVFPPCYSQSPPPLSKSGLKLVCNKVLELSRYCPETSTKFYVHEFGSWSLDQVFAFPAAAPTPTHFPHRTRRPSPHTFFAAFSHATKKLGDLCGNPVLTSAWGTSTVKPVLIKVSRTAFCIRSRMYVLSIRPAFLQPRCLSGRITRDGIFKFLRNPGGPVLEF